DEAWFFDTEVLITAQRLGLRIHEVPVDWVDDLDSRVAVAKTAWLDLCGVARMMTPASRRRAARARRNLQPALTPMAGHQALPPADDGGPTVDGPRSDGPRSDGEVFADELLRFAGVGLVSTLAYVLMFALLEPWIGGYTANAVAIIGCSLGNTAAHRGMAGSVRHGLDRLHRVVVGTALLGVSLTFTTFALMVTRALGLDALAPELVAVTVANVAAAAFRFAILRTWVFRPRFGTHLGSVALDHPKPLSTPLSPVDGHIPLSTTDRIPTRTHR
ncbi:MAG TPA: hypothetical protein VII96_05850, partial [Acidimicrobiales bacterium]